MAVKCFDLLEVVEDISTESDILTILEARDCIKDKFATYHELLDDRESELLAKLELLEETNKPELNHVRSDLIRLRGIVDSFNDSLGTNTLKVFHDKQKSLWEEQIQEIERSELLLSHVRLNISDENFAENLIQVIPFLSKAKFRTELAPLLKLKPKLNIDWYFVSNAWFSKFATSINLTTPQPNDMWEFSVKIPIQTTCDSGDIKLLHSKAWDMLLAFNGLSPGSIPIKRQSYLSNTTNKVKVPKQATKHKCTIGHNDGNNKFSIECKIETFPYETYEDILNKLSGFSSFFTKHPPITYKFDNISTIKCDTPDYTKYTVTEYHGSYSPYCKAEPFQDTKSSVGNSKMLLLVIIPDSTGCNRFDVRKR